MNLLCERHDLTEWETGFLEDLRRRAAAGETINAGQLLKLAEIARV